MLLVFASPLLRLVLDVSDTLLIGIITGIGTVATVFRVADYKTDKMMGYDRSMEEPPNG